MKVVQERWLKTFCVESRNDDDVSGERGKRSRLVAMLGVTSIAAREVLLGYSYLTADPVGGRPQRGAMAVPPVPNRETPVCHTGYGSSWAASALSQPSVEFIGCGNAPDYHGGLRARPQGAGDDDRGVRVSHSCIEIRSTWGPASVVG